MFKKSEEINDLNDISLVNDSEERKSILGIIGNILEESFYNLIYLLVITLFDNLTLMFISRENDATVFINYQYCLVIMYSIILCFSTGIIQILISHGKQRKLYYESLAILIVFVLAIYLPLSLLMYFITDFTTWKDFLLLSFIYVFFKLVFFLNIRLLELRKFQGIVTITLVVFSFLQISLSYLFVVILNLSLKGVMMTLIISYFVATVITYVLLDWKTKLFILEFNAYLLSKNKVVAVEKDIYEMTDIENTNLHQSKQIIMMDFEEDKLTLPALTAFYYNLKAALFSLFYYSSEERSNNKTKNQEENFCYFDLIETTENVFNHHDRNNYKSLKKRNSRRNSEAKEEIKHENTIKEGIKNDLNNENTGNTNNVNEPLLINNENNNTYKSNKHFSFKLSFEIFILICKNSCLSSLNYLGFALIVIISYYLETQYEQVTNIILINVLSVLFLISYSFSLCLTNYISLESFTHSYNNKFKYTRLCTLTVLFISVILGVALNLYSKHIASWYFDNNVVKDHVEHIISLYSYFIVPHFASIMLDSFVITASEDNYISFVLSGMFSFILIPLSMCMYYFGFSYLICWYTFFAYNIIHLITLIFFLISHKVMIF